MKTWYVLWTYIANYSKLMKVEAVSAEEAQERTCGFYNANKEFRQKAIVYVFDSPPALIRVRGQKLVGEGMWELYTAVVER